MSWVKSVSFLWNFSARKHAERTVWCLRKNTSIRCLRTRGIYIVLKQELLFEFTQINHLVLQTKWQGWRPKKYWWFRETVWQHDRNTVGTVVGVVYIGWGFFPPVVGSAWQQKDNWIGWSPAWAVRERRSTILRNRLQGWMRLQVWDDAKDSFYEFNQ